MIYSCKAGIDKTLTSVLLMPIQYKCVCVCVIVIVIWLSVNF